MKKLYLNSKRLIRDPDVVKHQGKYFLCYAAVDSKTRKGGICIASANRIEEMDVSENNFVYITEEGKPWSYEIWAPELHYIDGSWYIYVTCDDGKNANHRMYVLENRSGDPLDMYSLKCKIADSTDKWAIDGNVFHHDGQRYFVWSGWEEDENVAQNLYIAKMKNAHELDSARVLISKPEYDWEKTGGTGTVEGLPFVNEGPFGFHMGEDAYIAYSAAGSWCEGYCIALLKLVGDDPMNPEHWQKYDRPILCENDFVKGAGHCTIVSEEDGAQRVFFHAWNKEEQNIQWNTVGIYCGTLVMKEGRPTIV